MFNFVVNGKNEKKWKKWKKSCSVFERFESKKKRLKVKVLSTEWKNPIFKNRMHKKKKLKVNTKKADYQLFSKTEKSEKKVVQFL